MQYAKKSRKHLKGLKANNLSYRRAHLHHHNSSLDDVTLQMALQQEVFGVEGAA